MSDEIVWGDPPAPKSKGWEAKAERLRARPGKFARVKVGAYNSCATTKSQIESGRYKGMPEGEFEAKTGKINPDDPDDNSWGVWAKYVGA